MGLVQGVVGGAEDAAEGAGTQGAEEEVEVSILKQILHAQQVSNVTKSTHVLA
jgi:hypothetical protein